VRPPSDLLEEVGDNELLHRLFFNHVEGDPLPPIPWMHSDPRHLPALVQAHVDVRTVLIVDDTANLFERIAVISLYLGLAQILRPLFEVIVDLVFMTLHGFVVAVTGHETVIYVELALSLIVNVIVRQPVK
jgi:hypothetical protein